MTLGATRGSNRIQSKGHFGVIKVFLYCNSLWRANKVAFVLCCCGDAEMKSKDREAESDSVKPSTRTPQRAQRRETSDGVRESDWISARIGRFSLNRLFSTVSANMAQVSTNQPDLVWIEPSLSRISTSRWKKKKETMWQMRPDATPTRGQRCPSRVVASDAGGTPLEPRLCILGFLSTCFHFIRFYFKLTCFSTWYLIHYPGLPMLLLLAPVHLL